MVICRGKFLLIIFFYGLIVGMLIKKYNIIIFFFCIVYFVCWMKIFEFVFCKKKKRGGVVEEGLFIGKNYGFEYVRD